MDGCIAWKDPNQAVAQRERMRESEAENEELSEEIREDEPVIGM